MVVGAAESLPVQATLSLHIVFVGAAESLPNLQATLQLFPAENPD